MLIHEGTTRKKTEILKKIVMAHVYYIKTKREVNAWEH